MFNQGCTNVGSEFKDKNVDRMAVLCWAIWFNMNDFVCNNCQHKSYLQMLFMAHGVGFGGPWVARLDQ